MTPESEKALRDWATSHQSVGLVQASQVLELFEELSHLREAMTWAVGFLQCQMPATVARYPDFHNAVALVSGDKQVITGVHQMLSIRAELAEHEAAQLRARLECRDHADKEAFEEAGLPYPPHSKSPVHMLAFLWGQAQEKFQAVRKILRCCEPGADDGCGCASEDLIELAKLVVAERGRLREEVARLKRQAIRDAAKEFAENTTAEYEPSSRFPLRFLREYDRIRITGKTSSPSDHPRVEKMIGTVAAVSVGKPDEPDAIKVWPDDEFVHEGEEKLWFCDAAIEELELLERYEE